MNDYKIAPFYSDLTTSKRFKKHCEIHNLLKENQYNSITLSSVLDLKGFFIEDLTVQYQGFPKSLLQYVKSYKAFDQVIEDLLHINTNNGQETQENKKHISKHSKHSKNSKGKP